MAPKINGGLVIKHNANQRYATNAVSASLLRQVAKTVAVPVQEFSVR
jgi:aspartyl aminopeptidase